MRRTYEEILQEMKDDFLSKTGMSADDASDIQIRMKMLAGQLYAIEGNAEQMLKQVFVQTATGEFLDRHASVRAIERKNASYAITTLTFSRLDTTTQAEVEQGTICSTADLKGVKYITTESATLAIGEESCTVNAKAVEVGSSSNGAIGVINVMVTPPQGIDEVRNNTIIYGGEDEESDEQLRKRVLESYSSLSNATNISYYKNFVLKYSGVKKVSVVPKVRGVGTVDIIIHPRAGENVEELIEKIENDLNLEREICVDILVKQAELENVDIWIDVVLEKNYTLEDVSQRIKQSLYELNDEIKIGERLSVFRWANKINGLEGIKEFIILSPQVEVVVECNQEINIDNIIIHEEGDDYELVG